MNQILLTYDQRIAQLTNYTIPAGSKSTSLGMKKLSNQIGCDFILSENWNELLLLPTNDTHKIVGIGDIFNTNKLVLGLRKAPIYHHGQSVNYQFKAIPYRHLNGQIIYKETLNDMFIETSVLYHAEIVKYQGEGWLMTLKKIGRGFNGEAITEQSTASTFFMDIISIFGLWLYRPYVEVGNKPFTKQLDIKLKLFTA